MAFRTPRGYEVARPPYQEIQEGVRPETSTVPMEAYTGLAPVRVDKLHDDPIVIDAGTIVGIATGGTASGKIFPAHAVTGQITMHFQASDATDWALPAADVTTTAAAVTAGPVLPLGVVTMPVYSFFLQAQYENYKRNENVPIVTDYMIQIPAVNDDERAIRAGDLVMINDVALLGEYGRIGDVASASNLLGRFQRWDGTAASMDKVIGRCYQNLNFSDGANSATLSADSTVALTTAGSAEFKGLERVQTVDGLGNAGSGTAGAPSWLRSAISDGSGNYYALTILVRL